jgi:hypothetical protein
MAECGLCFDTYNATIPASEITTATIEYYINATDGTNFSLNGTILNPNVISINFPPIPVTLSNPSDITHKDMKLIWTQNDDSDFQNYTIYQTDNQEDLGTIIQVITQGTTTTYTVTNLSPKTTYYFSVRVNDAGDLHSDSSQVSGTTKEAPLTIPMEIIIGIAVIAVAITIILMKKKGLL